MIRYSARLRGGEESSGLLGELAHGGPSPIRGKVTDHQPGSPEDDGTSPSRSSDDGIAP